MFTKLMALACVGFFATNVWAVGDDDSYTSYDSIVNELKADAEDVPKPVPDELNWEEVALSGGMSLTSSFINMTAPGGANGTGLLKGFEAHLGANLFSRQARAEVAFRSYAPEDFGQLHVSLREYEGRLVFLPTLRDKLNMRVGFGLTLRNMDVDGRSSAGTSHSSASTPASALLVGFEQQISRAVTVGPDLAYRSALRDSFDKSAWDAAIRLNASF